MPTAGVDPAKLDPASAGWLGCLEDSAVDHEGCLARLHELMTRVARREMGRRAHQIAVSGRELDDLAVQSAGDAMLAVLAKLDQFRGESRFTTWVYKFVMLEVSAKVARHQWQHHAPGRTEVDWEVLPDRMGLGPEEHAVQRELVSEVARAVDEDLTDYQRRVFVAVLIDGVPLEAVAVGLGVSRNTVYKALFDARRKVRAALVEHGQLGQGEGRPA
ncbi:RNA polymerase sigma factor [Cellulomonas sp. PhB150]|uniref:RNA polymerase sigma factor n=1 Tax=Cellulomonas sp. PhB150 TaxID=2485188 RepID=UPI000FC15FEB|nr:sigma-70 family RNA polymerase sigma factor [Cellulomonas sp. PhB150]ROS31113.1 RNA polymerase sigma-70 factor (ECF subfamily) [Cellulomonas sp. PhB150]